MSAAGALHHGYFKTIRQQSADCDYYPFTPPNQITQSRRDSLSSSSGRTTGPSSCAASSCNGEGGGTSPPLLPTFASVANVPNKPCAPLERAPSFPLYVNSLTVSDNDPTTAAAATATAATAVVSSCAVSVSDSEGDDLVGESIAVSGAEGSSTANSEGQDSDQGRCESTTSSTAESSSTGRDAGVETRSARKRCVRTSVVGAARRSARRAASPAVPADSQEGQEDAEGVPKRQRKRARK